MLFYCISMWLIAMILYSYAVRNNKEVNAFEVWAVIMAPVVIPIFIGSAIIIGFFE